MNEPQATTQVLIQGGPEHALGIWGRPSITALEAELAYFNARLEFIGRPTTINQKAQLAAFRLLVQSTTRILYRLRHPPSDGM